MRVGLVVDQLFASVPGGTGRYASELAAALTSAAAPQSLLQPWNAWHGSRYSELSVTVVDDDLVHRLPGCGPRILLCLDGELSMPTSADSSSAHRTRKSLSVTLIKGESLFAPASDGEFTVRGRGTLVQADVACQHATKKERHV